MAYAGSSVGHELEYVVAIYSAADASYSSPSIRLSGLWTSWPKVRGLDDMEVLLLAWLLRHISQKRRQSCQVAGQERT